MPIDFFAIGTGAAEVAIKFAEYGDEGQALFLQPSVLLKDEWLTDGLLPPKEPLRRNLEEIDIAADGTERVGRSTRRFRRSLSEGSNKSQKS